MELKELIEKLCAMNGSAAGSSLALVGYDVDRIHDYVFATSKPMEIAGASLIVARLDPLAKSVVKENGLPQEAVCFATGGTGLVLAPQSKASGLCDRIEGEFQEMSVSGSCTAAMVPVEKLDPGNGDWFKSAFAGLSAALRRRKDEKALEVAGWQAIPGYVLRCQSCGRFPATEEDEKYEGEERHICPSCLAKRKACREDSRTKNLEQARDLTDLVRREDGTEDALAVIYCDARDMGSQLEKANWEKASAISSSVTAALQACLAKARAEAGEGRYLDLLAGGDDLLILVPAPRALAALRAIREQFHSGLDKKLSPTPQLDIGLLVADCHLPAKYLFEYTRRLMKSAKSHGYELADACKKQDDAIDWMVIKGGSPLNRDIKTLRQECLTRDLGNSRVYRLTCKPYAWSEFCNSLLKVREAMNNRGVSRTQLKSIGVHLLEHPDVARLNVAYQTARSKELKEVLEEAKCSGPDKWQDFFVSKEEDGDYHTGYFDLLELTELEGE